MSSLRGAWMSGKRRAERGDHLAGLVHRQRRLRHVRELRTVGELERATSSADSTRTIESGASPIVPTTSSWPAWPIRMTV